jgi:hypothetical protein
VHVGVLTASSLSASPPALLIRNANMTTIPTTNTVLKNTVQTLLPYLLGRAIMDDVVEAVVDETSGDKADSAGISMAKCERATGTGTRRGIVSGHVMVLVVRTGAAGADTRGAVRKAVSVRVRANMSSGGVKAGMWIAEGAMWSRVKLECWGEAKGDREVYPR